MEFSGIRCSTKCTAENSRIGSIGRVGVAVTVLTGWTRLALPLLDDSWDASSTVKVNMPYFYINSDAATERRLFMEDQIERYRLNAIRIQAADDSYLPLVMFPSWLRKSRQKPIKSELGCLVSHLWSLREGLDSAHDHFVVMEDDAGFLNSLHLSALWAMAPKDAGILQLGFTTEKGMLARWRQLMSKSKPWTKWSSRRQSLPIARTLLYSISRSAAEHILNQLPCNHSVCDLRHAPHGKIVADYTLYSMVNTYAFGFPLVQHRGLQAFNMTSTIHETHEEKYASDGARMTRNIHKLLQGAPNRAQMLVRAAFC